MPYPVTFDVERPPPVFRRVHIALRLVLLLGISWIGHPFGLLWLGLPVFAAILISQKGGDRYLAETGPKVTRVLRFLVGAIAYLALLTDRLPGGGEREPVRFDVEPSGSPTVGSALLRIVYAIPSLIVLALLGIAGAVVWVVSLVLILVNERYPESFWRFLRALVCWEARLLAYLASLVDRYPPYSLDTGTGTEEVATR
jgi:Domain of unknown function (DUF4389)